MNLQLRPSARYCEFTPSHFRISQFHIRLFVSDFKQCEAPLVLFFNLCTKLVKDFNSL